MWKVVQEIQSKATVGFKLPDQNETMSTILEEQSMITDAKSCMMS